MSSKRTTKKLGSAPNIKAAAARLKLPVEMLSEAKGLGCQAFALRGSVDLDLFIEWLNHADQEAFRAKWEGEGAVPSKMTSDAWKAHFEKEWRRIKVEKELGKLISRGEVGQRLRNLATRQKTILEAYLTPEQLAEVCDLMQACVLEWTLTKEAK